MKMIETAVKTLDDNKGENISVIDVRNISPVTDYMVFVSAETEKQVKGLADRVVRELRDAQQLKYWRMDGYDNGEWIIIDYFDFMIHLFTSAKREYYDLENLFGDGERIDLI